MYVTVVYFFGSLGYSPTSTFLYKDIRALFCKANRKQCEMKQDTNTTKIQLVVEVWKVHVDIARISLEFLPQDEALIAARHSTENSDKHQRYT